MRSWRGWSWDDGNFGGSGLEPHKGGVAVVADGDALITVYNRDSKNNWQ